MKKCMLLEIMKCVHIFANLRNASLTAHNCLVSLEIKNFHGLRFLIYIIKTIRNKKGNSFVWKECRLWVFIVRKRYQDTFFVEGT